ncbi:uncharacterized protein V6R79_025852 [Siganus canaliculatus]
MVYCAAWGCSNRSEKTSSHPVTALSRMKMEEYQRAISFLQDIVHLFREIKIGPKGWWKPVQPGVIMATTSILAIQEEMLSRGHKFVLTSRFTQDCLENTFSCVRSKNPVPTPVEFHHALRIISVGQFLTTINSGSYQEDDSSFLADFLDRVEEKVTPSVRVEELTMVDRAAPDLTKTEKCILFYLAGYIVHKVIKFSSICGNCKTATQHSDDSPVEENSMLLKFKEYKSGALCHPSQDVYDIIHHIEELFRTKAGSSLMELPNAVSVLEKEALAHSSRLPSCCGVKEKIMRRFIRLRLQIEAKKIHNDRKKHLKDGHLGSKSQSKKMKSVNINASSQPPPAISLLFTSQHHYPSTISLLLPSHLLQYRYYLPANITTPPPTCIERTSLLHLQSNKRQPCWGQCSCMAPTTVLTIALLLAGLALTPLDMAKESVVDILSQRMSKLLIHEFDDFITEDPEFWGCV